MLWWLVRAELRRWGAAGQTLRLWWRDDDARQPGEKLDRLLTLAQSRALPLTLAVIPDGERSALGRGLRAASGVHVIQHGVDHVNRREATAPGEFGRQSSSEDIAAALAGGWGAIACLPGAVKVLTPPWNAAHPALAEALLAEGYLAWSAFGEVMSEGPPKRLDAHLDLMRWAPPIRFRGETRLLGQFLEFCARRRRRRDWSQPIGLLTHHLQHDEPAWTFLEKFLAETSSSPAVGWRSLPDLLAGR